jgi:hypothetical protein
MIVPIFRKSAAAPRRGHHLVDSVMTFVTESGIPGAGALATSGNMSS